MSEPFVFTRELWNFAHRDRMADERNYRTACERAQRFGLPVPPRPPARRYQAIPPWAMDPLRQEEAQGFQFIFEEHPSTVPFDKEMALRIFDHPELCPVCQGAGHMRIPARGSVTGIQVITLCDCPCSLVHIFYGFWHDPAKVDTLYRNVRPWALAEMRDRFRSFVGSSKDVAFAQLLEMVQKPRLTSMLMCGPSDTGKTTLLMAIYARIVREWAEKECKAPQVPYFWRVTATKLSQEFRAWELRDPRDEMNTTPAPTVTVEKVGFALKAGHRPYLLIEELDKYKLDSEFQNSLFLQVVDRIYAAGGAIFATSNLTYQNLRLRLGEQYGPALIRRITGLPEGCLVDFSAGTVNPGFQLELKTDHVEGKRTRSYTPTMVTPGRAATEAQSCLPQLLRVPKSLGLRK